MIYPIPEASDSEEFRGFDEARYTMRIHESRAQVFNWLETTRFLVDRRITAVHVNNTTRADRVFLTAYDHTGLQIDADTLYTDEPGEHLDVVPEFDHDFTNLAVPEVSELKETIRRETGWVINMTALRAYDLVADRRETQRAVFLAHLQDMMNTGQIKGFFLGGTDETDAA